MNFVETRGNDGKLKDKVSFSEAILQPAASFGGLYVPETLPQIDETFINEHLESTYSNVVMEVLKRFKIDVHPDVITSALKTYNNFDNSRNPAPLVQVRDDFYICELYHGPTRAFKDMALQPFGSLLSQLAKEKKERYLIMAATSGDTGPATLHTFAEKSNIQVVCLYPVGGTSDVQRLQMVTEKASNLKVIGIHGDFDDAQSALKSLLSDVRFKEALEKKGIKLSAANSVNFGRIIFQIMYHIWSYIGLVKEKALQPGEKIYGIIPSGNFGNALGLYYAKEMGLPVEKIIIASNENHILTDFIKTGKYDLRGRKLKKTASPAMDILKSSNVERVLYHKFGAERTKILMDSLQENHYFELNGDELKSLQQDFDASYSDDTACKEYIRHYVDEENYLMDPHTATCIKAYEELIEKPLKVIAYSTAEWTKFSPTVLNAIKEDEMVYKDSDSLQSVALHCNVDIPDSIRGLFEMPIIHTAEIEKTEIESAILAWL